MSGGYFGYNQNKVEEIADELERIIRLNGKVIPYEELDNWDKRHYDPDDPLKYFDYSPEVIAKFKEGSKALRKAYVYAQRIDWLLSGDDGEAQFLERLEEDLNEIK